MCTTIFVWLPLLTQPQPQNSTDSKMFSTRSLYVTLLPVSLTWNSRPWSSAGSISKVLDWYPACFWAHRYKVGYHLSISLQLVCPKYPTFGQSGETTKLNGSRHFQTNAHLHVAVGGGITEFTKHMAHNTD